MKRFILTFAILALITSCKTQSTIHIPPSTIIKDSVSVTYRQGVVISPAAPAELAEPESEGQKTIMVSELEDEGPRDSYRSLAEVNSLRKVPQSGTTMPRKKSAPSAKSARATTLRVDTVYIERWHTRDVLQAQPVLQSQRDGPSAAGGLSAKRSQFYKNCTWGFWILLLLTLGRIAFRIMKAIYLRK